MTFRYGVVIAVTICVEPGMKERWHFIIAGRSEFTVIWSGGIIIAGWRVFLIGCFRD
jgi:hypothetical protein